LVALVLLRQLQVLVLHAPEVAVAVEDQVVEELVVLVVEELAQLRLELLATQTLGVEVVEAVPQLVETAVQVL
jgi:uncharacterized membrane protein